MHHLVCFQCNINTPEQHFQHGGSNSPLVPLMSPPHPDFATDAVFATVPGAATDVATNRTLLLPAPPPDPLLTPSLLTELDLKEVTARVLRMDGG